jgi:hypothetical protein
MSIEQLFEHLWHGYTAITPQAENVHALLAARGETVRHDHIALRTFGVPELHIETIDRAFVAAGYEPVDSYEFPDKKLIASHYEHPSRPLPKLFISALEVERCSDHLQEIVADLTAQVEPGATAQPYFAASGRPWQVSREIYLTLLAESEYAAWLAAFGFRANHFTVDVGQLTTFSGLGELNHFLAQNGFVLDDAGGEIQGSPDDYLEQSSTRADEVEVEFSDGTFRIPSCYYQFARRYAMADGRIFDGFVPRSPDELFESTDVGPTGRTWRRDD